MNFADIASGITAFAAIIAAVAAIFAAVYTKRAAEEAAKAAKAAAEQVELQRPRPIVVISFSFSFSPSKGNMADDNKEFWLQNIGDSPAFDVEVSSLETPGEVPGLGEASRLETGKLPCLVQGLSPQMCAHSLMPQRGVMSLRRAAGFVDDARSYFNQLAKIEPSPNPKYIYEIKFNVSYRSLDGRRFRQHHRLLISFTTFKAWVEPVGSLLEAEISRDAGEGG